MDIVDGLILLILDYAAKIRGKAEKRHWIELANEASSLRRCRLPLFSEERDP